MANFTEKAITETLNEMLKTRTIDKITVKDLTDECGISRNTFYYHFHDIYEVLIKSFIAEADELLKGHETSGSWEKTFVEGLSFLYENKTVINHTYWNLDSDYLDRFLNGVVYQYVWGVVKEERADRKYSDETVSIAADFYKNALLGAVCGWIEDGMKDKPEELAQLYDSIFSGTIDGLMDSIEAVVGKK